MARYLYNLLHQAESYDFEVDVQGNVKVDNLIEYVKNMRQKPLTLRAILNIAGSEPRLFVLTKKDNEWYLRINHEYDTKPITDPRAHPQIVCCEPYGKFMPIKRRGLQANANIFRFMTNIKSFEQKASNIYIYVNMAELIANDFEFYSMPNGEITARNVNGNGVIEPKFITQILNSKGQDMLHPNKVDIMYAGCIVFKEDRNGLNVCLVQTHKDISGFPKGGKNPNEPLSACALRELSEETGIAPSQIESINASYYVDEFTVNGTVIIRLYLTKMIPKMDTKSLTIIDTGEIKSCAFMSIKKATVLLDKKRQEVLHEAVDLYNSRKAATSRSFN